MAKTIPKYVKGTLNFGSITDSKNEECAMQTFYCLSPANHDKLCDSYPDGLLLHGDYMDQIDTLVASYTTQKVKLLSTDKFQPPKNFDGYSYEDYIRVFAGDGLLAIDESFTKHKMDRFTIYTKFGPAREYSEYTPMSIVFLIQASMELE